MLRIRAGRKKMQRTFKVEFNIRCRLLNHWIVVTDLERGRIASVANVPAKITVARRVGEAYLSAILPPDIIAQSDSRQDNSNDAGPGIKGDTDCRSQYSGCYQLNYHHTKAGTKDDGIRFPEDWHS